MKPEVLYWSKIKDINLLKSSLNQDKVSVCTTDTVLGLLAKGDDIGFSNLNRIKRRFDKPYILLVNSLEKVLSQISAVDSPKKLKLLELCWPGPVTIIFNTPHKDTPILKSFNYKLGIRIPEHKPLLGLLENFEGLFSTSANISGEAVAEQVEDISPIILKELDYIMTEENVTKSVPSTILDFTKDKVKVIREGAYKISILEEMYGEEFIKGDK